MARAAAAAMLTAILLTLAQANAEFLPAAKSAVAAMFFENAGSPAYKGRAAQASGYTLKSILDGAVPLSGIDGSTYFGASDARPQAVQPVGGVSDDYQPNAAEFTLESITPSAQGTDAPLGAQGLGMGAPGFDAPGAAPGMDAPGMDATLGETGFDAPIAAQGLGASGAGSGVDAQGAGSGVDERAAGSGADATAAGSVGDAPAAGSGADATAAGSVGDALAAGSGADATAAGSVGDALTAGSGADATAAGSGPDALAAGSGVDAGAGAASVAVPQYSPRGVGSVPAQANDGALSELGGGAAAEQASTASTGVYIWPACGNLTSPFGYREATVGSKDHKGIDICASSGDPIYAADAGEVIVSEWNGSFGNVVEIKHDNGHITLYAHCSSLLAGVGERVSQGQVIALMGSTGRATAVHLHFELKIGGANVDPEQYLQ